MFNFLIFVVYKVFFMLYFLYFCFLKKHSERVRTKKRGILGDLPGKTARQRNINRRGIFRTCLKLK